MMTPVTFNRTKIRRLMFDLAAFALIVLSVAVLTGCPPNDPPTYSDADGEYSVSSARLLGTDATFSIKDELIYPVRDREGISDTSLNLTSKELTRVRCTWCHECGFEAAWDWDNYGSSNWSPQYKGEEWAPIVERMMRKEMSFLQEEKLVVRIFEYLRDDSLGVYDESGDDKGAVRIEVDELPTPVDPEMVIEPEEDAPEVEEPEGQDA